MEDIVLNFCYLINLIIPKKQNQVFFYSSPDYSDNARALYEQMVKNGLANKYSIIWAVKDSEKYESMIPYAKVVRHRSLKNLFCFCRSRYIIRTHSLWGNKYVKGKQVMCIAWHGMPLKRLVNPDRKVKPVKGDILISTASVFDNELAASMGLDTSVCKHVGLPRNDALFAGGNELEELFPGFGKRIIWMPTFRKAAGFSNGIESELGIPCVNKKQLSTLNDELKKKNYLLILKLHPWSAEKLKNVGFSNIVCLKDSDISDNCSLYKLLGQTDALITDYSSVYIDYLLTDKPICFVYDDIDEYRRNRGFALEPAEEYMPGDHITDFDGLLNWLSHFDVDNYKQRREELRKEFFVFPDDKSSQRLLSSLGIE